VNLQEQRRYKGSREDNVQASGYEGQIIMNSIGTTQRVGPRSIGPK
jgi:hypothetical protein